MSISQAMQQLDERMQGTISNTEQQFRKMRTGRASVGLIESLKVVCYDSEMPLSQLASITTEDARTLVITPWDKTVVQAIEKAIITSNLGINPTTAGLVIRLVLPPMTAERRKEFVRSVKHVAEEARISIRGARQKANMEIKALLKDKLISEDEERKTQSDIQKKTDVYIQEVNELLAAKEADLMKI